MSKLNLDRKKITACRKYAKQIADSLQKTINQYTTVSIERAILRLFGVDGVNKLGIPYPNLVVDAIKQNGLLPFGAANVIAFMMARNNTDLKTTVHSIINGTAEPAFEPHYSYKKINSVLKKLCSYGISRISVAYTERSRRINKYPMNRTPWLYAIVATGNIYEDTKQARSACFNGADCIAVIRSTAQSLMDYVPYGATTKGFAGTYATQENFRIMRKALDEYIPSIGRYVYQINYCSGLCMSEIAAMGAMERLDMMLNDAMYGIIFRDINMYRTFVDQHFSRMINARAGITINTGEDNYLTTADAMEKGHTVPVSDFINEQLAKISGLAEEQLGLGHAFEIDPQVPNSLLYEIASAQLIRELFPGAPIKYMPPTKHVTGNIFRTHAIDTMFNLTSVATDQSIHLVGMLTEALHTPMVHDRFISLESARYVKLAAGDLAGEITFKHNGIIQKRAQQVLDRALHLLEKIQRIGLMAALERGYFADIKRPRHSGKGFDGVVEKNNHYRNPFEELWTNRK